MLKLVWKQQNAAEILQDSQRTQQNAHLLVTCKFSQITPNTVKAYFSVLLDIYSPNGDTSDTEVVFRGSPFTENHYGI